MPTPNQRQRVLDAMPGTVPKIALRSGLCEQTVRRHLRQMRDGLPKRAFVYKWRKSGPCDLPEWHQGNSPCRPRPIAKGFKAYRRAYRVRKKEEAAQQKAKADAVLSVARAKKQSWFSALVAE